MYTSKFFLQICTIILCIRIFHSAYVYYTDIDIILQNEWYKKY